MFTTRKMRKSRTSLRGFEGLETRELLAADLFAANSTAPVEELSPADAPAGYYVESSGSADEGLPGTVEDPVYTGDAVVDDNWALGSGHEYGHEDTALSLMAMNAMDETAWHDKEALERMRSAVKDLSHAAFNNSVAAAHKRIQAEKDSAQLAMTMAWVNVGIVAAGAVIGSAAGAAGDAAGSTMQGVQQTATYVDMESGAKANQAQIKEKKEEQVQKDLDAFADDLSDNIKEYKELIKLARKIIMDSAELKTQAIRALG